MGVFLGEFGHNKNDNYVIDCAKNTNKCDFGLTGVRQVGKTWLVNEFGRRCYANVACCNFNEHEEYKQFFENPKDDKRILDNLMFVTGCAIKPAEPLIVFDEIQECPKASQYAELLLRKCK